MLPPAPSHRILIVTDAWLPQVNGVVRTLTTVAEELRAMGHVVEVIGPGPVPHLSLPDLSRHRLVAVAAAAADPHDRGVRSGSAAHRHRGAAGPRGAALGAAARRGIHHRVPHPLRRICAGPAAHSDAADLCLDAALPWRRPRHHGRHRQPARGTPCARLSQHPSLVARCGPVAVQAGAARRLGLAAARSSCMWAGGGGEEHRGISRSGLAGLEGRGRWRPSACRAATALSRTCCSPARAMARRWHAPMPVPTCSYSRR